MCCSSMHRSLDDEVVRSSILLLNVRYAYENKLKYLFCMSQHILLVVPLRMYTFIKYYTKKRIQIYFKKSIQSVFHEYRRTIVHQEYFTYWLRNNCQSDTLKIQDVRKFPRTIRIYNYLF